MDPGDAGLLFVAGSKHRFIHTENETEFEDLNAMVQEEIEKMGEPVRLLKDENRKCLGPVSIWTNSGSKAFIENRNRLLDRYARVQKEFWKALEDGLVGKNTRLLVMIQQFDMHVLDSELLNDNNFKGTMELFQNDPWTEQSERVKKIVKCFKDQKSQVDVLYFKADPHLLGAAGLQELSKGFLKGVTKLSKISKGKSDTVPYDGAYLYAVN